MTLLVSGFLPSRVISIYSPVFKIWNVFLFIYGFDFVVIFVPSSFKSVILTDFHLRCLEGKSSFELASVFRLVWNNHFALVVTI